MRKYGWRRQLMDQRDFKSYIPFIQRYPASVDLTSKMPAVYDQGQLGSCTANGIAGALEYDQMKQKEKSFTPSRLFIYYNERVMENSVNSDAGAEIRDGVKSVTKQGACKETTWPYVISKFANKPPSTAYTEGLKYKSIKYMTVEQSAGQMEAHLVSGFPVIFGFTVYESFESNAVAKTGTVPMPKSNESVLGGHCVICVGYKSNRFICRNSWGTGWGKKGYFTLPYDYLLDPDMASDFWVIESVT